MTSGAITEPVAGGEPPATLTVRRSWAIGAAVAAAVVIVALAVALAVVAVDHGDGFDGRGLAPAADSAPPGGEGMMPPGGLPYGGGYGN
jgi:hypothetical protein